MRFASRDPEEFVDNCPWKGRRTVENVLGRVTVTIGNLRKMSSSNVTRLYARMQGSDRTRLMQKVSFVIEHIVEEYTYKLELYSQYPWRLLEVLAPLFGGSIEQSKRQARDAIAFYDGLPARGTRAPRGFARLFERTAIFRRELETYLKPDVALGECKVVLEELLAYSLAPTQERSLEAEHGVISAAEKRALGAQRSPASVAPIVRF